MPNFIEGVINLRGDLVPVIDLRARFGVTPAEGTEEQVVISRPISGQVIGLLVDSVSEIQKIATKQIQPMPPAMSTMGKQHLTGAAKVDSRLIMLLDIQSILSDVERASLEGWDSQQGELETPRDDATRSSSTQKEKTS